MHPVFISYARGASADAARALRDALPGQCFLDEPEIDVGDTFPERIVDGLLASRVVVVFASEVYFQRRYCLWELQATLGPHDAQPAAGHLDHLVVVLDGLRPEDLPAAVRRTNWPTTSRLEEAARLVQERVKASTVTLGQRYEAVGRPPEGVRTRLLELTARPPAAGLSRVAVQYGLPPASLQDDFVGRWDDLHWIDFWLRTLRGEPGTAESIITVEGFGGQGKTRLVAEYAHRFGPRHFPGGLIWIDGGKALEPQFHGVLQAFDASVPDLLAFQQQKRDVRAELTRALREHVVHRRILWIVDDVPEPEPNKQPPPLSTYCPALGQVPALMTSRRRLSFEGGRRGIVLRELDADAAIRLLQREVPAAGELTPGEWKEIADWVGCLPLALTLLNRVILAGEAPRALLAASQSQGTTAALDRHMEALRGEVEEGSLRGVTEAMSISYEKLSPASQGAARLLAQFAPLPIPMAFIETRPDVFTVQVKSQLTHRSFVVHDGASAVATFGTMHRLMADYLRTCEVETSNDWMAALNVIAPVLNRAIKVGGQWQFMEACLPHAHQLLRARPRSDLMETLRAALEVDVSATLMNLGRLEEALEHVGHVMEVWRHHVRKAPDLFEPGLANCLSLRSLCLKGLGRSEEALVALGEGVRLLEPWVKVSPVEHEPRMAELLMNLTACLGELGRAEEALEPMRKSVEIRRRSAKAGTGSEAQLAKALVNFANCLDEVGRGEEALSIGAEAVSVFEAMARAHPERHAPELGVALLNQSTHLSGLGRHEQALQYIQRANEVFETLARVRPEIFEPKLATSLLNLSVCLSIVGRQAEAMDAVSRAVDVFGRLSKTRPQAFEQMLAKAVSIRERLTEDLARVTPRP